MPFSWYHPDIPDELKVRPQRAVQMYVAELKERAALLMRLGFSEAETRRRLRGNVRWDFELHQVPEHAAKVDEVVATVYRARGLGGGGTPSLEG